MYLVTWQFMGERSKTFDTLADACAHAKIVMSMMKPVHIKIELI